MNTYSVRYYTQDLECKEVELDAKNLTMLEQIVNRIQYNKSKHVITTSVVWIGKK